MYKFSQNYIAFFAMVKRELLLNNKQIYIRKVSSCINRPNLNRINVKLNQTETDSTKEFNDDKGRTKTSGFFKRYIKHRTDIKLKLQVDPNEIDWKDFRECIFKLSPLVKSHNIDSIIMDTCHELDLLNLVKLYVQFLRTNNYEINIAVIVRQLRLYYMENINLTEADKIEMLNIYDDVRKKYSTLPQSIAEACIICLTMTDRWKEAIKLLEDIKAVGKPAMKAYNKIVSCAFLNNDPEIGWHYLCEMIPLNIIIQVETHIAYLRYCERNDIKYFKQNIEKMFRFYSTHCIRLPKDVLNEYIHVHNKLGYPSKFVNISVNGICSSCQQKLGRADITPQEIEKIRQYMLRETFKEGNLYQITDSIKCNEFFKFIDIHKPFDIVVDALNVYYRYPHRIKDLRQIIIDLAKKGNKILAISRNHLKFKFDFRYIDNIYQFHVNDREADDLYVLYAVLSSGINAKFLSADLMREHKYLLYDNKLKNKFKNWQLMHQCNIGVINGNLTFVDPPPYVTNVQKNHNSWHLPYYENPYPDSYDILRNWTCITHPNVNY